MLSEALKLHRRNRGWSLRELAKRSDISASALSKVERGELSLTYDKLQQLAEGLGVDISALFRMDRQDSVREPMTRRSFASARDGETVTTNNYVYRFVHTDIAKKAFNPIVAEIRARSLQDFGPLVVHPGEEFTHVIEGAVTLITEHYSPLRMVAGESVYFDSGMPHAYLNSGDGVARVLCICSERSTIDEASDQPTAAASAGQDATHVLRGSREFI